jgi:hypothetical protein
MANPNDSTLRSSFPGAKVRWNVLGADIELPDIRIEELDLKGRTAVVETYDPRTCSLRSVGYLSKNGLEIARTFASAAEEEPPPSSKIRVSDNPSRLNGSIVDSYDSRTFRQTGTQVVVGGELRQLGGTRRF